MAKFVNVLLLAQDAWVEIHLPILKMNMYIFNIKYNFFYFLVWQTRKTEVLTLDERFREIQFKIRYFNFTMMIRNIMRTLSVYILF